jgi:hypothetical protein
MRSTEFRDTNNPSSYILIPEVSSERRHYIPMGYYDLHTIPSGSTNTIPNADIFHFGILNSSVHNSWIRTVSGKMKSDYRYSGAIGYNNFIWPEASEAQKAQIENLAQAILDARELYPDSSLADLYDPLAMPLELTKAHQALDKAVLKLYGLPPNTPEPKIVAHLFTLYQQKIGNS